jgi:hypothetical protein
MRTCGAGACVTYDTSFLVFVVELPRAAPPKRGPGRSVLPPSPSTTCFSTAEQPSRNRESGGGLRRHDCPPHSSIFVGYDSPRADLGHARSLPSLSEDIEKRDRESVLPAEFRNRECRLVARSIWLKEGHVDFTCIHVDAGKSITSRLKDLNVQMCRTFFSAHYFFGGRPRRCSGYLSRHAARIASRDAPNLLSLANCWKPRSVSLAPTRSQYDVRNAVMLPGCG